MSGYTFDPPELRHSNMTSDHLDQNYVGTAICTPGDLNNSGTVELDDAILAIQVCTGKTSSSSLVYIEADVNDDKKIGLEEAVYVLRVAAGLIAGGNG